MRAMFIGIGLLVLVSLFKRSAGKVQKKYSYFSFLDFSVRICSDWRRHMADSEKTLEFQQFGAF